MTFPYVRIVLKHKKRQKKRFTVIDHFLPSGNSLNALRKKKRNGKNVSDDEFIGFLNYVIL